MLGVEGEVGAPALEAEAAAVRHDAAAEAQVVGVDEGDGVSLVVHHLEAHCARALGGVALLHVRRGPGSE